jgi:DNA-binding beta-propeller fold protein YncE
MFVRTLAPLALVVLLAVASPSLASRPAAQPKVDATPITLRVVSTYAAADREFDGGAAEIVAHDPQTQRLFIVNGQINGVDIVSVTEPLTPTLVTTIAISPTYGSGLQSVAVSDGILAVAVSGPEKTDPGVVAFFDADGAPLGQAQVGALPDMLTFTPDGTKVLTANEGEPNSYGEVDSVDPEGSVSIVDISAGPGAATVTTVGFTDFNAGGPRATELPDAVRIYGPGASVAQDLEPEYIAISPDGATAYVTLQENNALATIDIETGTVESIVALGFKDHSLEGNGLDSSDRDGAGGTASITIGTRPVLGMYQPDGVAAYQSGGQTFLVTANEGDARDWPGFAEEARVSSLALDPTTFPGGADASFARLNVTETLGDTDTDGDYDELYTLGARSFSIWDGATGALVYDSGDELERITAETYPDYFNASNTDNDLDSRSDNKGPEPEGVALGAVNGRTFAFVGLERIGGVMVYDVTDAEAPAFVQYINNRDFAQDLETDAWRDGGDLGPEGLLFVPAAESPTGTPLLIVANEISGTTTIYEVVANVVIALPWVGR